MATTKQQLGDFGENFVSKNVNCPSCKRVEAFTLSNESSMLIVVERESRITRSGW